MARFVKCLSVLAGFFYVLNAQASLINSGFETGNFSGWTVGGNAANGVGSDGTALTGTYYSDNVVNVRSGEFAAWGNVSAFSNPQVGLQLSQTLAVDALSTYDVGFWLSIGRNLDSVNGAGRTYQILVDGLSILSVNMSGLGGVDTWIGNDPLRYLHESAFFTTAAGQTTATVTFILSGSGTSLVGFSYDDFHFEAVNPPTAVPAPQGLAIFALGLFGMLVITRRRQRAQRH